ncbi:TRAP transporter large permease subunit, partial [Niveibacterium sp.]|uniref:TRAP transporter large permease subunit n=1 Tax=Niveibacterium sp. TaxID=2017444 RepID=UPI0035AF2D4F
WFGVLLGVNMQTSFMHPPFGFALFYLRSVAPASVRTTDIYWGAVPFVVIQVIMVALVIVFPGMVTMGLDKKVDVDVDKVQIDVPLEQMDAPELTPPTADESAPEIPPPDIPPPDADSANK